MITCPVTGVKVDHVADHPVLGFGFRPFFALAGLQAAVSVPAWILVWLGELPIHPALPSSYWHAHEMLFGFAVAALAGFLLTAVPNWTGQGPIRGHALLLLTAVWVLGRLAMWFSGSLSPAVVAVADLAFLPLLAAFQAPAIVARSARRNGVFVILLLALFGANLAIHGETLGMTETARWGLRLALGILVLAITLVGGRIVPAFTQGGLKGQGIAVAIAARPRLDAAAIVSVVLMVVAEAAGAPDRAVGVLAAIAAALALGRLCGWHGHRTFGVPLLWVLHLGMAWLVAGLAIKAAAMADLVPESMALHALGAGAVGTMVLAVMTRATLGHTGRPLVAVPGTAAAYLAVALGALLRILVPLLPDQAVALTGAAGLLWSAGFAGFLWLYGGMLLRARADGP